jgi:hypothetical protein
VRALGHVHPREHERLPAIDDKTVAAPVITAQLFRREVPDVAVDLDRELDERIREVQPVLAVRACGDLDGRNR